VPVYDAKAVVSGEYQEAVLLPEDTPLAVQFKGDVTETAVPRVDIHAMAVFSR
jgi:hypothetical protein